MRLETQPPVHLTYCLNVHPGETWGENLAAIETYAVAVRDAVGAGKPFGLGLRLSARAAETLAAPAVLARFRETLARHDFYVFTVNGFPYGDFHGKPVKTNVYRPDWRDPHRLVYTKRLTDILGALLPEGVAGSISTVPVSYGDWMRTGDDFAAALANLRACAAYLAATERRTGRRIRLALEPEPDCCIEDTAGAIDFFDRAMAGCGDRCFREYVGICFDTCHLAVRFEDPTASLLALVAAGIAVPKVQVSAALRLPCAARGRERLARFGNPVYLNQVKVREGGLVVAYDDLPAFLASPATEDAEARIHCHVPLHFDGDAEVGSTHAGLTPSFFRAAMRAGVDHFEIETYTFGVLPPELQAGGIVDSVAAEYRWVLARLPQACAAS